jgi:DNA topoisomerase I
MPSSFSTTTPSAKRKLKALAKTLGKNVRRRDAEKLVPEDAEALKSVGLTRSTDAKPGIRRMKKGTKFAYVHTNGKAVTDIETLARIKALAIPPAWKSVWICSSPKGHLQATGMDARGRKQYRYHPLWRQARDLTKYYRLVPFAEALPGIRSRLEKDLAAKGLPRQKVLAAVVRLLEESLIRIGNEEYAKSNKSYGLTTMRNEQVAVKGDTVEFRFKGKSGKRHDITVEDSQIASIVARCRALPGDELFEYVDDDGKTYDITAADVNAYLKDISGKDFTAKDFRTWSGTVHAALLLTNLPCATTVQAKRSIVRAIEQVAQKLGNTPAVCRKSYVHPLILDTYPGQELTHGLRRHMRAIKRMPEGLSFGEQAVLSYLKNCLTR